MTCWKKAISPLGALWAHTVGFPLHQSSLHFSGHPLGVSCFSFVRVWRCLELGLDTQVEGSVPPDCPQPQTPVASPGSPGEPTDFCLTWLQLEVPRIPSSSLRICSNRSQNSGQHVTITSLWQRILKGNRNSQMRKYTRQGLGAHSVPGKLGCHHPGRWPSPTQRLGTLYRQDVSACFTS